MPFFETPEDKKTIGDYLDKLIEKGLIFTENEGDFCEEREEAEMLLKLRKDILINKLINKKLNKFALEEEGLIDQIITLSRKGVKSKSGNPEWDAQGLCMEASKTLPGLTQSIEHGARRGHSTIDWNHDFKSMRDGIVDPTYKQFFSKVDTSKAPAIFKGNAVDFLNLGLPHYESLDYIYFIGKRIMSDYMGLQNENYFSWFSDFQEYLGSNYAADDLKGKESDSEEDPVIDPSSEIDFDNPGFPSEKEVEELLHRHLGTRPMFQGEQATFSLNFRSRTMILEESDSEEAMGTLVRGTGNQFSNGETGAAACSAIVLAALNILNREGQLNAAGIDRALEYGVQLYEQALERQRAFMREARLEGDLAFMNPVEILNDETQNDETQNELNLIVDQQGEDQLINLLPVLAGMTEATPVILIAGGYTFTVFRTGDQFGLFDSHGRNSPFDEEKRDPAFSRTFSSFRELILFLIELFHERSVPLRQKIGYFIMAMGRIN